MPAGALLGAAVVASNATGASGIIATSSSMAPVSSFCGLCLLLVIGKALRMKVNLFQMLYLPSSVIGGLLGLAVLRTLNATLPDAGWEYVANNWILGWDQLAGFLINIVFR